MSYSSAIPVSPKYPKQIITIADHLRKCRIDLKLSQAVVARIIKVSEDTITYWENSRAEPRISLIPRVIAFLGYNPYEIDASTLGGKIKQFRYTKGLSIKNFSKLVSVDPLIVKACENDELTPTSVSYQKLIDYLNEFK